MKALTCLAVILALIAVVAGFFGFMFIIATVGDIAVNHLTALMLFGACGVSLIVAIVLAYISQRQPTAVVVGVELPRNIDVSNLKCKNCGGALSRDNMTFDRATGAITVNLPVAGSHSSGLSTAPVSVKAWGCCWPPTTSTLPSGRTTLLLNARA